MRRIFTISFLLVSFVMFSQEQIEFQRIESDTESFNSYTLRDSLYNKNLEYTVERNINNDLKDKYSGREFIYDDNVKEVKPEVKKPAPSLQVNNGFSYFMSTIFPVLLALIVVLIVLKAFVNINPAFWRKSSNKKIAVRKLISEEDDIDASDLEALLQKALQNKDYRLATRYYYLSLLKGLSDQKHIEYHKDKTNSDYLFELKDQKMRSNFSYLSYIYSYVWYGEFPVSKPKFVAIEKKYQSFLETIT